MNYWKLLLLALLLQGCSVSQNQETTALESTNTPIGNVEMSLEQMVEEMVAPFISKEEHIGLSLALIDGEDMEYFHFGKVEKGSAVQPTNEHLWEIGSISKTYTAILALRYCEANDLALDSPVNDWLPDECTDLSLEGQPLTFLHLLNHTSGLPRLPADLFDGADEEDPYAHYSREMILDYVCKFEPNRVPGTVHEYSNLGFALVGLLLERHSGKSYAELLEEYVFHPLGLEESYVQLDDDQRELFVAPYLPDGSPGSHWTMEAWAPTGALVTTIADLARYAQAQLPGHGGALEASLATTKQVTHTENENMSIGLGWFTITTPAFSWYFHNGGTGGFSSLLLADPANGKAMVMISNNAFQQESEPMGFQLFKVFTEWED